MFEFCSRLFQNISTLNVSMCGLFQRRSSIGSRTSAMLSNWTWITWTNVLGPVAAVQVAYPITNACPATPPPATAALTLPELRRTASGPQFRPHTDLCGLAALLQPAMGAHIPLALRAAARTAFWMMMVRVRTKYSVKGTSGKVVMKMCPVVLL